MLPSCGGCPQENAARHIMQRWGVAPAECAFLCGKPVDAGPPGQRARRALCSHAPCGTTLRLPLPLACADDDNDLGLAHLVSKAYLPGITANSVAQAVQRSPERFHVAAGKGVFATEEILRSLVAQHVEGQA